MSQRRFRFSALVATAVLGLLALFAVAGPRVANQAPAIALTAPAAGTTFAAGQPIVLGANATDTDGSIARVDFYAGKTLLGRDTSAPYAVTWNDAKIGSHVLKAVAVDNRKASTSSARVTISVQAAADTIAPSVPSGVAATAQTGDSISLQWNPANDNVGGCGVAG